MQAYKGAWDSYVHTWLVIKVATAEWVFKWRLEAEQKMKAAGAHFIVVLMCSNGHCTC